MSKKVLLVIGILIIIGVAAFLILSGGNTNTGGETRVGFSISDYFPFGRGGDTTVIDQNTDTQTTDEAPVVGPSNNNPIPKLRKISNEPVAGSVLFSVGTTTFVRFVEKGTGNVYEARSDSNVVERLTNTTIPKIVRAEWLPNATGFLAQTVDLGDNVIETSFVKLSKNTTNQEDAPLYNTTVSKLPTGIEEFSISPDSSKIFYYIKGVSSFWFVSKPDGTGKSYIYSSPILEWTPKWTDNKNVFMYTKPSIGAETFAYNFDTENKTLTKTSISGFGMSFNPQTNNSLVANGGASNLYVVNNKTLETTDLKTNAPVEKCAWSGDYVYCATPITASGGYPDVWYKGVLSTNDYLIKIDTVNLFYSNIMDLPNNVDGGADVDDIKISKDESQLIFRNKKDGFLWMLRIGE